MEMNMNYDPTCSLNINNNPQIPVINGADRVKNGYTNGWEHQFKENISNLNKR
jgi:hypothetical protein